MTQVGNKQMFEEFAKERPDTSFIRYLLNSGKADINALSMGRYDQLTVCWYMQGGIGKHKYDWDLCHPFWGTIDTEKKLLQFKSHFYPLLDILEDYNFNIMNGSTFRVRPDGTKHLHSFAGFRSLDLAEFRIMARHDPARVIQFFERLYFSKGHHVDDTSVTGIPYLSPLLWSISSSYKPELILYFLMKGARWNKPAWQQPGYEARITNFAVEVDPAAAAAMILMLQRILGINYATGSQGSNLRGFLAAAYGTVVAVGILQNVVSKVAKRRRIHFLTAAPWIPV